MAGNRFLVRLSGGEHMVIDDAVPPNGTTFLPESVMEGAAAPASMTLSTFTLDTLPPTATKLGPLSPMTLAALKSKTVLKTEAQ